MDYDNEIFDDEEFVGDPLEHIPDLEELCDSCGKEMTEKDWEWFYSIEPDDRLCEECILEQYDSCEDCGNWLEIEYIDEDDRLCTGCNEKREKERFHGATIVFDTETTGLPPSYSRPTLQTCKTWPRMIQLAYVAYDSNGDEIASEEFIIKPDGFTIPPEATAVNGITNEYAEEHGVPIKQALDTFFSVFMVAGCAVAHNYSFDINIVYSEIYRLCLEAKGEDITIAGKTIGVKNGYNADECFKDWKRQVVDTMIEATDYCAIPGGQRGYKWPRLTELHQKLFGESFDNEHDALADARATARCYWELKDREVL